MDHCLTHAGISVGDLSHIGFYDKPLLKFERILETYLGVAPRGFRSFLMLGPLWMKEKLFIDRRIRDALDYHGEILYAEHHESHAASAFYPSPFETREYGLAFQSHAYIPRVWSGPFQVRGIDTGSVDNLQDVVALPFLTLPPLALTPRTPNPRPRNTTADTASPA